MDYSTPLDEVEFLARSAYRVEILNALAERVHTRQDLHEETGISQPTLGRILGSFQDHGWVEKAGQEYALTPFGELLAEEFSGLLDTVETMQRFRDIAPFLPLDELRFDLREFGDAAITVPRTEDALAHIRRGEDVIVDADDMRLFSPTADPTLFRDLYDRLQDREQFHEAIIGASALDTVLENPDLAALIRSALQSDEMTVYRYEGPFETPIGIADGRAFIMPFDDHGVPCAFIEADNDAIRSWVVERLDECREQSSQLTVESLSV